MKFCNAKLTDLNEILEIIREAQQYLKEQGINQWQNNYPNSSVIEEDIRRGECYVLKEGDSIIATTVISFEGEPTYDKIYEGNWLGEGDFAVLHRVAVASVVKGQGIFGILVDKAEEMCIKQGIFSIKVDTHKQNKSMQAALHKKGFSNCGIIYLADGNERVAFEKLL